MNSKISSLDLVTPSNQLQTDIMRSISCIGEHTYENCTYKMFSLTTELPSTPSNVVHFRSRREYLTTDIELGNSKGWNIYSVIFAYFYYHLRHA